MNTSRLIAMDYRYNRSLQDRSILRRVMIRAREAPCDIALDDIPVRFLPSGNRLSGVGLRVWLPVSNLWSL